MLMCECDNCGSVHHVSQLNKADNLNSRLEYDLSDPRCVEPYGECPKCGALAYPVTKPRAIIPSGMVVRRVAVPAHDGAGENTARLLSVAVLTRPGEDSRNAIAEAAIDAVKANGFQVPHPPVVFHESSSPDIVASANWSRAIHAIARRNPRGTWVDISDGLLRATPHDLVSIFLNETSVISPDDVPELVKCFTAYSTASVGARNDWSKEVDRAYQEMRGDIDNPDEENE